MRPISGRPGLKVTFQNLAAGVKAAAAGKDINYEGAFSPVDFDAKGDIGSAVLRDLGVQGHRQDRHAEDHHVPRLVERVRTGGGGLSPPPRDGRATPRPG